MTRREKIMQGVDVWTAFYRANPHRFVHDYLHVDLHLFQKILIVMMNLCVVLCFIGARGIGKTFLCSIFCVVRAILYPGTKVVIASGRRSQAVNVLEKIMLELKPNSPELAAEIDERQSRTTGQNPQIVFHNGSYIKVVTASDSARGNRANLLLIDEFRMVSKDTIDTILRKFLAQKRSPRYRDLDKEARRKALEKELNQTFYLSSAYFADHWSFLKCKDTFKAMLSDKERRQFVCGLPYQLSIREGLLDEEAIEEEMSETDFNEIKFMMEYEALWWGDTDGAFFDFSSVSKNRKIQYPMLPSRLSSLLQSSKLRIQPKQPGELRLLSADIALMSSRKHNNDASAIFVNQMLPTKAGRYTSNIVYTENCEGMRTEEQALVIRRLYDEFQCDYIVLDTAGVGLGVYDCLARDINDPETGEVYPALSCCNDKAMAERCTLPGAEKAIWSIKGSAALNSECAVLLREGFRSGRVRLPVSEFEAEELLADLQGFQKLNPTEKASLLLPYVNTTLLVNELVKLQHEEVGGKIRVQERTGMRKDRYSSLSYNYYVAVQLEPKVGRRRNTASADQTFFLYRAPKVKERR